MKTTIVRTWPGSALPRIFPRLSNRIGCSVVRRPVLHIVPHPDEPARGAVLFQQLRQEQQTTEVWENVLFGALGASALAALVLAWV